MKCAVKTKKTGGMAAVVSSRIGQSIPEIHHSQERLPPFPASFGAMSCLGEAWEVIDSSINIRLRFLHLATSFWRFFLNFPKFCKKAGLGRGFFAFAMVAVGIVAGVFSSRMA